jgi:putative thymidine phosphorylase
MDEISKNRLGDVLTTYFAASGYSKGFSNKELSYLTRAMVDTGEKLEFPGIVADKHSIGGVPGTRTTLIVVPIIAACGFKIPKSSSRAITSPGGTADDMEVLAPVIHSKEKIYEIVKKTPGCIVWGGSFGIAPADDVMINVEKPLLFESYDKILVSIMAKKIAFGSNHIVIDLPYGKTVKVHKKKDAEILKDKFLFLAREFNLEVKVMVHKMDEPLGKGIGAVLETREAVRVLQQKPDRPIDLEERSLMLATELLELCLRDSPESLKEKIEKEFQNAGEYVKYILTSGQAFSKMKGIIKAQGGNSEIDSEDLKPGKFSEEIKSKRSGRIKSMNITNLTLLARLLGAPEQKGAGIYLHKKIGDEVSENEPIYEIYSQKMYNLREAKRSVKRYPVVLVR